MKKNILALAVGGVLSASAQAAVTDIVISEYIEGNGNNRAIELTNTGSTDYQFVKGVDLVYADKKYSNKVYILDPSDSTKKKSVLEGKTIRAGQTLVIYNPEATSDFVSKIKGDKVESGSYAQVKYNSLNFLGYQQIQLVNGNNALDVMGIKQGKYDDPNKRWGENQRFIRHASDYNTGQAPRQSTKYDPDKWQSSSIIADEKANADNYKGLGDAKFYTPPGFQTPTGTVDFEITAADNAVAADPSNDIHTPFWAAMKRYADKGQKVHISINDINPTVDGTQRLVIARPYSFDYLLYRTNMTVSYDTPIYQPNQLFVAGSPEAKQQDKINKQNVLYIESKYSDDAGELKYYPSFYKDPANNVMRIGDSIAGFTGVIKKATNRGKFVGYVLKVDNEVTSANITHNIPRTHEAGVVTKTSDDHFAIKIATQNVLNLFNSPYGGPENLRSENRGALTDLEYERQKAKLVEAIYGLDADIVGLMEIENNGFADNSAISEFVEAINNKYYKVNGEHSHHKESETNKYAFLGFDKNGDTILDELDGIGSDVITSGIIYRPSKVSIESSKIIPMPSQHAPAVVNVDGVTMLDTDGNVLEDGNNYMRDTVMATFIVNQTGKRLTVAVNHFKSKGSTCYEDWQGFDFKGEVEVNKRAAHNDDLQGNCEHFRVAAAVQMGEELEKVGGDRVVIGDMNSYAKEDPMLVLTEIPKGHEITTARDTFIGREAQFSNSGNPVKVTKSYGYISAVDKKNEERGEKSWSYSWGNEIGALDHILLTKSLENRLIDAKEWHINAAESKYYDYTIYRMDKRNGRVFAKGDEKIADRFYAADAFRSSDHDSAIVSLSYKYGETDGQYIHITANGGVMDIPYTIPAAAGAKKGDVVVVSLTPRNGNDFVDMGAIKLPQAKLKKDGQSFISLKIHGVQPTIYTAKMMLERDGKEVSNSTVSIDIDVAKQDSFEPKVVVPEYDKSGGGSFGLFSIMSLLGLGFLRRRKA